MIEKENFGYLGDIFQSKVLAQIFTDRTFGENYINIIDPKYFDNQYFRVITQYIKEYYVKYDSIPTLDAIENIINSEASSEVTRRVLVDELDGIRTVELADSKFVQHKVINFCKQQELKKAIQKVQKILEKGDFESYDKCEDIIKRAINISEDKDNGEDALDNIENVLDNDERKPLPFGIGGFDRATKGGLGSGEVSLGIAPLGVGKSTCATKIANTNYNLGKTVLHIFFEDKVRDIKRKHYACWTGIPINDLKENKSAVIEIIEGIKGKGKLVLKKFPSYGTTFEKIRNWVKKQRQNNIIPDMIVVDYLDCIQLEEESWTAEGVLVRQFETLAEEIKIPIHLFTQGGRQSIGQEIVTSDMGGGSIKKSQFAHFLYSIGRTMEQQESGRANMSILKNRFGPAGVVFENVLFDNGSVQIDTDNSTEELTFLGVENKKEEKKRNRINDILQKKQKEKVVGDEESL
jgi:KaiC/GvpD/RAD55 family RecA-like ATPase